MCYNLFEFFAQDHGNDPKLQLYPFVFDCCKIKIHFVLYSLSKTFTKISQTIHLSLIELICYVFRINTASHFILYPY